MGTIKLISAIMVGFFLSTAVALGQSDSFSGSFTLKSQVYDAQGAVKNTKSIPMVVSPTRIKISGINEVDPTSVTKNMGAKDVLIRLDKEDFVFQISDTEAVVLRKQDLQMMINMAGGSGPVKNGSNSDSAPPDIQQTSETKMVNGYRATKVIITEADSKTVHHAWFTKQININLGMLTESWMSMIPVADLMPMTNLVDDLGTPVNMVTYRDGAIYSTMDLVDIKSSLDGSSLNLPASVKLVTLQEMMLNRMKNY